MRKRKLGPDPGLLLAGVAALPLIPLLFSSWFCLPAGDLSGSGAVVVGQQRCWDAWTSLAWIDLVLLFTTVAVIALVVMALMRAGFPLEPGPVLTVLGGFSFLLVAWRLVSPPWAGAGRAAAPFLALLCLAGVTGGGLLSARLRQAAGTRRAGKGKRPGGGRGPAGRRRAPAAARAGRVSPGFRDFNREG